MNTKDHLNYNKVDYIEVTLAEIKGSAPQELGAKIFITKEGLYSGTIGGGKLENHVIKTSLNKLNEPTKCFLEKINLQKDIGMSCGGEVIVFYEPHYFTKWPIKIFGAGHVSQALIKTLSSLQCSLNVYDSRTEWLEKIEKKENVVFTDNISNFNHISSNDYIVIMTKGHGSDLPILLELSKLNIKFKFLGLIGSIAKFNKIKKELIKNNVEQKFIDQIHCPIGLPIGNNTPEEIAISITAQLLQVRDLVKK